MRFFFILFLSSQSIHVDRPSFFVIWNVGQGQFTSFITDDSCIHVDMGGEFMSWRKLQDFCGFKKNLLALSHWDWDHISFITKARKKLLFLCILQKPRDRHIKRELLVKGLDPCKEAYDFKEIHWNPKSLNRNGQGRVFVLKKGVLLPGDSPKKEERIWTTKIFNKDKIKILVAGHHGSNTSSSEALLSSLRNLKMVFISARKKRYGHPHLQVEFIFKFYKIPMIRTEIWGNIGFEI